MELAQLHYADQGVVVVEQEPALAWKMPDISYETPQRYVELVSFRLEYSSPDVRDQDDEEEELVERLCGCRRKGPVA